MTLFKPKTKEEIEKSIASGNYSPTSILLGAAQVGSLEYVKMALNNGGDIHSKGDLALQYAARFGYVDIVKFLLENGANVHAFNNNALRWALKKENLDLLKVLKKYTPIPIWKRYRLLRRIVTRQFINGISVEHLSEDWYSTHMTFVARNKKEAMKKANKFWHNGEFGQGSICVVFDDFKI